ncbi:Calcitonin gene-related peptide type 1 receptor [Merluccius polli]|uniref:Calcitonin gene-related peptide type 1 receptor n=1 Tax=Merluccius polli TaxID=89951 RepID=A0AA47P1J0_MERPO|nr:Calcitonin gene-related peptide type 1 receptor [Merluccius polli]
MELSQTLRLSDRAGQSVRDRTEEAGRRSGHRRELSMERVAMATRAVMVSLLMSLSLSQPPAVASSEVNTTESNQIHNNVDSVHSRNKITTAQYECFQRILKESNPRTGPMCNTTWDGWLCWDETQAGFTTEQQCPDYYGDFDPKEMASKVCTDEGQWGRHPKSKRIWTNYTTCKAHSMQVHMVRPYTTPTPAPTWYAPTLPLPLPLHVTPLHYPYPCPYMTAMNLFYLVLIGHGLSLTSLFISLAIFFHFKTLSCQRITLHKNLFFSFVLNSGITIIWFTTVANRPDPMESNPVGTPVTSAIFSVSCKVIMFIHLYLMSCNYFWMLCEGIYLHTLIVVAVFAEKQHLMWYYLLGWGFPLVPALIHAVARYCYYNDICWIRSDTSLLYIIHSPICAALLVNLFFLLNIVRVLITKLKVTHQAESSLYMKAVRATLILIPLLGIQFILLPYKPQGHSEVFQYVMSIFMHYQGLLVATIFCFFNGEVQTVLRRHWNQQRMQFGGTFANAEVFRSASYAASSLTEVHRCYSIESHTEYLNGKNYQDIQAPIHTIHRSDMPFA